MVLQEVHCRHCNSINVVKYGYQSGHPRCRCKDCGRSFQLSYTNRANEPGVKESIINMALNGSGIRDTARVLGVSKDTVMAEIKKNASTISPVNPKVTESGLTVEIARCLPGLQVQTDEQWSYVGNKGNPRWLWYAIDSVTGRILAFVFGQRTDDVCRSLMEKLSVFNISHFYTDDWGSYRRIIPEGKHIIGKKYTQKIENKNLLLRTRIKRLARKTLCFSKSEQMHDTVIGLFINRYCFN